MFIMMAFEDNPDDGMSERLLGGNDGASSSASTSALTDDFELISERETLVFEDDFFRQQQRLGKRGGFFQTYLMEKIQPGSVKGSMFTMTVAIVGAGVLALPYAVQQAGLVLGISLIALGAIATNFTLRLLLECSDLGQARSYMDLASATGGRKLAGFTQLVVCMNLFGTSIGYLVGSAELIQLALRTFLGSSSQSADLDADGLLVLPLSLLRSLESLRFSSLFSIVCITFMVLVIVIKYFQFVHEGLAPTIAYQFKHLPLFDWRLNHLLRAVPLVVFSFTCHPNVLPIYLVLKRRSSKRMYKVMNRSIGIATTVYSLCGFFVVLTFGEATRSNFLKNNYHGDGAVIAGCLGFSIALILTVPLFVHTLRDNIREALLSNRRLDLMRHAGLSIFLVLAALFVALGSGDIASVLGVLGATTNPTICFMLPAFFIFRLGKQQHRASQLISGLMAVVMTVLNTDHHSDMATSDAEVLVRALGELAVSLRRRRRGINSSTEKRAVLKWLRSISGEELASLCCVEDVGFVKTLLHMAACSRGVGGGDSYVHEFQLLSPIAGTTVTSQNKRVSAKMPPKSAPREFVKRPIVRTMDGDVVGSFHSKEYEECSSEILKGLRVLNTLQSCDTVALSMEFFHLREKKDGKQAQKLIDFMDVISCGGFLTECPSESTLKYRVWGETKWLKDQGYYSLQALFVNHIVGVVAAANELNIWASWKAYQKDVNAKVPLRGLASKLYLVHEWKTASIIQQQVVLKELGRKIVGHLRELRRSTTNQGTVVSRFQAARSSLESLTSVLRVFQKGTLQANHDKPVDICFTCSFEDVVASPQAGIIKLLLAEHLQEQCSILLCARLSKEEEAAAVSRTSAESSLADDIGSRSEVKAKPANHSQRRRASRKKMLKQRRREGEIRAAQQTRFNSVLHELCEKFRRRQEEVIESVDIVLRDVIDTAIDEGQLKPGGWSIASEHISRDTDAHPKQKRKKKKTKRKKAGTADAEMGYRNNRKGDRSLINSPQTPDKATSSSSKPHVYGTNEEGETGEHSADTAGSDSSPSRPHLIDCGSDNGSTQDDGPRLSFFSNVGSTGTSTPAPALPLSTFGSHSLYSSSTTPFFLSLAPRDHHSQPPRGIRRGIDDEDDENQTLPANVAHEAPTPSDSSNFEWYLPSVFSLQTSAQRTISPTPALDWHFNNWQFKTPDGGISDKGTSNTTVAIADLEPPPPPSSSSSTSSASSRFANGKPSGSTRKYSLASFSKIAGMDSNRRGFHAEHERQSLAVTSIREHGDGSSSAADSDNESDFLYREGGFFDRQRSLKRRRRPWPFGYAHEEDEGEISEEHDVHKGSSPSVCFGTSTTKDDGWTECTHCCKCSCHRDTNLRNQGEDPTLENEEAGNKENKRGAGNCKHEHASTVISPARNDGTGESDAVAMMTKVFERITQLEEKLTEKTKVMEEEATAAASEITTLKQTVATLTAQLHNVENNIQDLQLQQASATTGGLEDSSLGNASSLGSPSAPFSPAPSSLDQQAESPPTAAPPFPETYPAPNPVMGPFVSVPLSVLPPRSKLHWDLCEFAAQLQADSDARLPAQLAAQRLCMATVQSLWPRAQVRPYGSHVTRLVLPSSDVDLVICLPKVRRDAPADAAGVLEGRNAIKETWQQNLARKLKQEPWVVRDSVKTLPHAAVPIITLLTAPPYNVRLDISFEGPGHNGLATNDVVLALLHEFPPLAPMMLVLKSFAIERGLAVAYSGGLSSYALLLLVARYLQEHSDTMPNGFANASRAVQHSLSSVQAGVADFGLMLMGFLDFYGNRFDPRTTGISVASRCFLNRESTFMAGAVPGSSGMDPHQMPHQYQQYAADDAAVDDRTSQYGYAQHWQVPPQPHMQLSPNSEAASAQGSRRYGYRSSLDLPASRVLEGMNAATGLLDYQQLQQQTYDPHKFDPVFIEDPLCPSNNVGRNCFRIMQIRRAFSAAHLALLAASRDPAVFGDNRMGLVAGVGLHPDNILRSILGPGAPVNGKSDAATSATVGVASYIGAIEHPYAFHPYNQQQAYQQQQHHHHPPQQPYHNVGVPQPRNVNAYRNESGSRRHSESESERLTTRSTTSATSHHDRSRKRRIGSPRLVPQSSDHQSYVQAQMLQQESGRHPQRQSSLKQIHIQNSARGLSRKNSERSMSLSLSFADVVRDGGGISTANMPKTSPLARPPRFSRDDMALEESINERWETKDDSELK
ncbi:Sodium-coupled neutral amino acid transporter 2 [Phytophthora citrophthora]|uniref:Sodium-coupled neutral amino acid transporter 2 n=1 Tax=Phytophthora citrophthora TaxID=4793 RepID=A0AAD9LG12_9STRA|nr:Sodium-coupled neutral amino acid transporter 2 [Phytophthora citrophthora]